MQLAETNAIIGARVAELRSAASMSQAHLAEALAMRLGKGKIDPTTITRLERGQRPIAVAELIALASVFNLSPSELLPEVRVIDQQLETWLREAQNLSVDMVALEAELEDLAVERDAASALWKAFKVLRRYRSDGTNAGVGDALAEIAEYVESCTDGTPLKRRIDLVTVLQDLDLSPELIAEAIESAGGADDGVSPTKLVRYINLHAPFPRDLQEESRE